MKEAVHSESQAALVDQPCDVSASLALLQQAGAGKYDPIQLHYLQVLAKRTNVHQGRVKHILEAKLAQALATFKERFEQAKMHARNSIAQITPQHPKAAADLQTLLDAGDLKSVRQFITQLTSNEPHTSLGALTRLMTQHAPAHADAGFKSTCHGATGLRPELKNTQYFRNIWSKFNVEKRVFQALHQAPKNAGPINSHNLVLRSLALMRDISPDYLNQLTSYVDTLLCLDQCVQEKPGNIKKTAEADHSKKVKGRRTARKSG